MCEKTSDENFHVRKLRDLQNCIPMTFMSFNSLLASIYNQFDGNSKSILCDLAFIMWYSLYTQFTDIYVTIRFIIPKLYRIH